MRGANEILLAFAVAGVSAGQAFGEGTVLEQVIVTAQKREQSVMDVPISVTAVDGSKLADAGIQRFEDLNGYVPSLQVVQDPIGDSINIRGIQSGIQAGFEQSVGTFVDGIYRGRPVQSRYSFFDVAMVEVLRGPQPVLFGKNTIAGALNVRTAKPTATFQSELSGGYTSESEQTELQGMISGPVSDTLRGRAVALSREMRSGWVRNLAYDEHNPASEELFYRVALEWDAGEDTTLALRYEAGDWTVTGQPWVLTNAGPLAPFLSAAGVAAGTVHETWMGQNGFGPFAGDRVLDFGSAALLDGTSSEAALTVEHMLGSGGVLTAILGSSQYEYDRFLDADFSPLPVLRFDDTEDYDQSSFELRLASDTGNKLEYIAGLYYQRNVMYVDGLTQFNVQALNALLAGDCGAAGAAGAIVPGNPVATAATVAATVPGSTAALANNCAFAAVTGPLVSAGVNGASRYAFLDQTTKSWSVFVQPTWNVTDAFRATLGLRYTAEEKTAAQGAYATDYRPRASVPIADPAGLQAQAAYAFGEFTPHLYSDSDPGLSRDEDAFTWSFNLQYDLTPSTMVYAVASTGFKAGGFNSFYVGLPPTSPATPKENSTDVGFDQEDVLSYEVGAKASLFDGATELSVAAFRTEYDDLQVSVFSGNTTFVVQNAARATSQGVELDSRWQVNEQLRLQGSAAYLDFQYDRFPNQACVAEQFLQFREAAYQSALRAGDIPGSVAASLGINNQVCAAAGINDLAGRTSANSPEWSGALTANWIQPVGNYRLNATLSAIYTGQVYRQDDLDPFALSAAVTRYNGSLIFGPASGAWDIAVIGRNLTDETTVSWVNDTPLFNGAREGRIDAPRTVELRGRLRF